MVMARPQTNLPLASVCLLVLQVVLASSALAVILLVQTEHAYKIAFALLEDLFKMENASQTIPYAGDKTPIPTSAYSALVASSPLLMDNASPN